MNVIYAVDANILSKVGRHERAEIYDIGPAGEPEWWREGRRLLVLRQSRGMQGFLGVHSSTLQDTADRWRSKAWFCLLLLFSESLQSTCSRRRCGIAADSGARPLAHCECRHCGHDHVQHRAKDLKLTNTTNTEAQCTTTEERRLPPLALSA